MTPIQAVLTLWMTVVLVGISALGIYITLFKDLAPTAPWYVRWVAYIGQGLIVWTAFCLLSGLAYLTAMGLAHALR